MAVLRFEIVRSGRANHFRDDETLCHFEVDTFHDRDTAPMRARQAEYLRERMRRWSRSGRSVSSARAVSPHVRGEMPLKHE